MIFRQSLIKTWMSCPLQAKFKVIDGLPDPQNAKATFGSIIHYVLLENFVRSDHMDVEKAVAQFEHLWSNPDTMGLTPDYWPKYTNFSGLMEKGREIIRDFASGRKWETRKIVATEHHFLVDMGEHQIEGTVDLLEIRKNSRGIKQLRITDLKTSGSKPSLMKLRADIQFTAYYWASLQPEFWLGHGTPEYPAIISEGELEQYLKMPRVCNWYHLYSCQEIDAGPRDDNDFLRLYRACKEIEKALKHEVYVPNISGDSCTFCPYTEPCGLPILTDEEQKGM